MEEEKEKKEESPPKKSSLMKFIILGCLVLLLGGGGFFGWSLYAKGNQDKSNPPEANKNMEEKKELVVYPLKPFLVNLFDKQGLGKRYLKVTIELEIEGEEGKQVIEKYTTQLRDTTLLLLSSLSFNEVNSMEGKVELKQAVLSRVNQVLGKPLVHKVFFTEFVVQ